MKKRNWLLLLGLSFLLTFIGGFQQVFAGEFNIKKYDVNVNITQDGNLDVTQRVTYRFKGENNGVFYDLDRRGLTGVKNIAVEVEQDGKVYPWTYTKIGTASNGSNGVYTLTGDDDYIKFKVYHPVRKQTVTFIYHYTLLGGITNYKDTAELNWKVIGSKWNKPLHNVKIVINLPQKNVPDLQSWAHGPLNGYVKVEPKEGRVTLSIDHLPAYTFLETHTIFPTSVTPGNPIVKDQNRKAAIQKQEAELVKQANEKRERIARRQKITSYIVLAALVINNIALIIWMRKNRGPKIKKFPKPEHSFDIPNYPPEVCSSILSYSEPGKRDFTAYLLYLAAQKKIKITELPDDDYLFTALNNSVLQRKTFLYYLFTKVGNGTEFKLSDIQDPSSDLQADLARYYHKWQKRVHQVPKKANLFDSKGKENGTKALYWWFATVVAMFIATMFSEFDIVFIGHVFTFITFFLVIRFHRRHLGYTQKGLEEKAQISAFRKMLKDIGRFDLKEFGEIILWEDIMPYAVSFGCAEKVVKALQMNFSDAELNSAFSNCYYPLYFSNTGTSLAMLSFADTFNSALASALPVSSSSSSSSSSGGSGGFSGGSSGGFGGGSGGGAF
ncbi:DUF2207 domain-containing protein [Ligilactobacillus ceti]|uniref:Integral membrane protein n=1 Tax=Ligilactobacillus ceti DSM 22408 TaxID=1122146 RepID=A0A0R2KJW8_9LACO|nr:DUF2207 domain-containing protein [Ligilactobacillus ceti]KRN89650.1 hypothetical protein IV53_GL001200 [Ligilactobacillus ceti DSM 22408]